MLGYGIIPIIIALFVLNYFLFIRNKRYLVLLKELAQRPSAENKKGVTLVILCAIEALLIPWILMLC
jgi:hypothetical protein